METCCSHYSWSYRPSRAVAQNLLTNQIQALDHVSLFMLTYVAVKLTLVLRTVMESDIQVFF